MVDADESNFDPDGLFMKKLVDDKTEMTDSEVYL